MVVHYDKLKAVVGSTPASWLGTEVEGTPVVNENEQNRHDRTQRSVDVVAVETVPSSVNVKHDLAPVMTTHTDRHTGTRYGVGREAVDRSSDLDVYNAFPAASLQGSRPRRTAASPWYLKDYFRG